MACPGPAELDHLRHRAQSCISSTLKLVGAELPWEPQVVLGVVVAKGDVPGEGIYFTSESVLEDPGILAFVEDAAHHLASQDEIEAQTSALALADLLVDLMSSTDGGKDHKGSSSNRLNEVQCVASNADLLRGWTAVIAVSAPSAETCHLLCDDDYVPTEHMPTVPRPLVSGWIQNRRSLVSCIVTVGEAELRKQLIFSGWSGFDFQPPRPAEVALAAGRHLVAAAQACARTPSLDRFDLIRLLSSEKHEGRAPKGKLLVTSARRVGNAASLAPDDGETVDWSIEFKNYVSFGLTGAVRKLLDLTAASERLALATDLEHLFGLVRLPSERHCLPEGMSVIEIEGFDCWALESSFGQLMRVDRGRVALPKGRYDRSRLGGILMSAFGEVCVDHLLDLVDLAVEQTHGTMLVVSEQAESEAARLHASATLIEPQKASGETFRGCTALDGAVLLEPSGVCHAVGVILDGAAGRVGKPERGARFNSMLRYKAHRDDLRAANPGLGREVLICISEDGAVSGIHQPEVGEPSKEFTL